MVQVMFDQWLRNEKTLGTRLTNSRLLSFIIILVLVKPEYLARIPLVSAVYNSLCSAVFVVFLFVAIFEIKVSFSLLWLLLYNMVIIISTIINSGNLIECLRGNLYSFTFCLVIIVYTELAPDILLFGFYSLHIYFYINLLSVLIFPNGLYRTALYYQNWFLGYKNIQVRLFIPMVCFSVIYSLKKQKKIGIYNYILFVLSLFVAIKVKSTNGIFGLFLLGLLIFLAVFLPGCYKIVNLLTVSAFCTAVNYTIFLVTIPEIVFELLQKVNKSSSFKGRYRLWKIILKHLKDKIVLGYGYLSGSEFARLSRIRWGLHAHNWMLGVLMLGGVVLFTIFIIGVFYSSTMLGKKNYNAISRVLSATLMCFMLMGLSEAMTNTVLVYPLMIMAMQVKKLLDGRIAEETVKKRILIHI